MQRTELIALAEKVCTYLPGWSIVPCEYDHVVKFGDSEGRIFYINGSHAGKGRLSISGNYPRDKQSNRCYGLRAVLGKSEHLPYITVSDDKSPKVIAGDIQRRLLPDFLIIHAKATELEREDQQCETTSKAAGQRLQEAGARLGKFDGCYQSFDMSYDSSGYIREGRVCGNSVSMDIRSITVDQAVAILKIMQQK